MPALCLGGVLSHACPLETADCGQPNDVHVHADHDTDHHHAPDSGDPEDCHHESDCSSDPCVSAVATAGRVVTDGLDLLPVLILAPVQHDAPCLLSGGFVRTRRAVSGDAEPWYAIHDSDLPLLI